MAEQSVKQRIEWVDIFKALVIISVVIGHSTGKYNIYIYQFHMAAFFFVSGYTTNLKRRGTFETILNKACTMLLPFFSVFFIFLLFFSILDKLGLYTYLCKDPFIGSLSVVSQLFLHGNNYIYWMGATWFITVLFCVVSLHKILYTLCGTRVSTRYIVSSVILLLLGYGMVASHIRGQAGIFVLDLPLIAQFYFFTGIVAKEKAFFQKLQEKKKLIPFLVLFSTFIMYYFGIVNPTTVDYPSRKFGFVVADVLAALNGTFFIYLVSCLLVLLPIKLKKCITYIGQNTLGILFFHFIFFKVAFGVLIYLRVVPLSYLQNFIPTDGIGSKYCLLLVVVAISLSIVLWKLMCMPKIMRILLGQEKGVYDLWFRWIYAKPKFRKFLEAISAFKKIRFGQKLNAFKREVLKHKFVSLIIAGLGILSFAPIAIEGITVNDELQARFRRMHGFIASIKEGIQGELSQGRPMRILAPFQSAFSFVSANAYIYKAVQILIIVVQLALFGYFIYKLFGNKKFSVFTCITALVFLPVTFEHSIPNAFIALTGFPMIFLLLSLILFINYAQTLNRKLLVSSMVLFFISMLGYEFIVTFVLLYPVIYYAKAPVVRRNLRRVLKYSILPLSLGLIYLILMLGLSSLMSTHYSGAQIEFVSFKSSFDILATLFKSALPGYFMFNAKYEYLFNIYCPGTFHIDISSLYGAEKLDFLARLSILGASLLKYILVNMLNLRTLLLLMFLFLLLLQILPDAKNGKKESLAWWFPVAVGLAYAIIPAAPISISKLYQGNVSVNFFTSLPVSLFLYFSIIFTICFIIWKALERTSNKYLTVAAAVIICLYCLPVQAMNSVFSEEHKSNYNRLISIEQLFDTATIKNINRQSVYAPDLYETYNTLAVQDTYWTQFAGFKGLSIEVNNGENAQNEPFRINYQDNQYFVVSAGNEVSVLSAKRLSGTHSVQLSENEFLPTIFENEAVDGSFYRYNFKRSADGSELVSISNSNTPFADLSIDAGPTLKTANILYGYNPDGWLEKNAEFKIQTGEQGKVILNGYYPNSITGNETGTIYIDDKEYPFRISEASFTLEFPAKAKSVVNVKIKNDFDFQASLPDMRRLSFILTDAQGK